MTDTAIALDGLRELRSRRAGKRTVDIHWIDALYQAYLTGIICTVLVLTASGWVGGDDLSAAGVADVLDRGPGILGLVASVAVAVGLRSGSRGGPLAVEEAEVRHALLAPVPLGPALRGPALRQLRFVLFVGAVVGAIGGQLAYRRIDANPLAWIACGAAFGAAVVALSVACAWLAAGRRLRPAWATVLGAALIGWAIADVAGAAPPSPLSFLGRLPLWPLEVDVLALVPILVALALLPIGLAGLAGISLEHAQRRSALVGQLRFAATMRDLRTVLVLRRQLAQERPRARPWLRWRRHGGSAVRMRGWRALARIPASRLARLTVLGVGAALAAHAAWNGSTALVAVAGLLSYVAGLDAVEPLAQELDHPSVLSLAAVDQSAVLLRHLVVPAVTMLGVAAVGVATIAISSAGDATAITIAAIVAVPAALTGCGGAVISTIKGTPDPIPTNASVFVPPEAMGMRMAYQAVWPPLVATIGLVPVVIASNGVEEGLDPVGTAAAAIALPLLVAVLVTGWVRVREDLRAWFKRTMDEAEQARTTRTREA